MNWEDPLKLESQLTQEEVMAMDMARQYSQEKLLPRIVAANQNEQCGLTSSHYGPLATDCHSTVAL